MTRKSLARIMVLAVALIQLCALCGCSSSGERLSEANNDARLFMELSDYTGDFERTITIKETVAVQLKKHNGPFDISWDVRG